MPERRNRYFAPGKRIGLPKIGVGLTDRAWDIIKAIIVEELKNEDVTIVE